MSFETDLKKLQKMWDKGQGNSFNVQLTQSNNLIKSKQDAELPPRILQINSHSDLGGTYQNLTLLGNNPFTNAQIYGYTWSIKATLPQEWIPFARFTVGYNAIGLLQTQEGIDPRPNPPTPSGDDPFAYPGVTTDLQSFVEIQPISSMTDTYVEPTFDIPTGFGQTVINNNALTLVNATWHISFATTSGYAPNFQVKLYMILLNPNLFV